jgi:hypothetical protein
MTDRIKFSESIGFKCPPRLRELVDRAAAQRMTSPSEFIRQATLKELRADGITTTNDEAA